MVNKWTRYFMGFAYHAAVMSKDRTKVGAVLVGPRNDIRLTGYNGPPIGVRDLPERRERPAKYLYASHAEANIIAFAARNGISTDDCALYSTHHPCAACARSIIQAGIKMVAYCEGFDADSQMSQELAASREMLDEAGVLVVHIPRTSIDE